MTINPTTPFRNQMGNNLEYTPSHDEISSETPSMQDNKRRPCPGAPLCHHDALLHASQHQFQPRMLSGSWNIVLFSDQEQAANMQAANTSTTTIQSLASAVFTSGISKDIATPSVPCAAKRKNPEDNNTKEPSAKACKTTCKTTFKPIKPSSKE